MGTKGSTQPTFPMPGTRLLGRTVVASCWQRDDPDEPALVLVLFLNDKPPFFTVAQLIENDNHCWQIDASYDHFNIVPAINGDVHPTIPGYVDMGGDS